MVFHKNALMCFYKVKLINHDCLPILMLLYIMKMIKKYIYNIYIYKYIKCIVTNKYASRVLEYNYTNSQKIYT